MCLHSSLSQEKSVESNPDRQSLFTRLVVQGLSGQDGIELAGGFACYAPLGSHVQTKMYNLTSGRQTASFSNIGGRELLKITRPEK